MIDTAAKKEAHCGKREKLFEEKADLPGEVSFQGKIIESRQEIRYPEWRRDLDKSVMASAKTLLAKKTMVGVQQWRGLKANWDDDVVDVCPFCHRRHLLAFGPFLKTCSRCELFRKKIKSLWSKAPNWDDELLEGRVKRNFFKEVLESEFRGVREDAFKACRDRIREWEKALSILCKEFHH